MKVAKFKNLYIKNKKRIFIALLLSALLIIVNSIYLANLVSKNTINYALKQVEKTNMSIMRKAFQTEQNDHIELERLLRVVKNSKEEIVEVDFNLQACSEILENTINFVNSEFDKYNFSGYRLDIPIGFTNESPLLINLGPKIPIRVEFSDYAFGNVNTVIREFGINNALLEVYLEIKIKTSILYPLNNETKETSYESLIISKVITGTVPDFYGGTFNSKSNDVSLPLN